MHNKSFSIPAWSIAVNMACVHVQRFFVTLSENVVGDVMDWDLIKH